MCNGFIFLSLVVSVIMSESVSYASDLVREFSGIKLDQSFVESVRSFRKKGFDVPLDTKEWSASAVKSGPSSKKNIMDALIDGACAPQINQGKSVVTLTCAKQSKGSSDLVESYTIKHFITSKGTDEASAYRIRIKFNENKEAGLGILGKFGPRFQISKIKCENLPTKLDFAPKGYKDCFLAVVVDDLRTGVGVCGYGDDLKSGIVSAIDVWDKAIVAKLNDDDPDAKATAKKLGF